MTPIADSAALIPAAGEGTRLGRGPKALLRIGERTLLEIVADTLAPVVESLVVAAPPGREDLFESLLAGRGRVVSGGESRQASIDHMIDAGNQELLLIQDVSRPFASRSLCRAVLEAAAKHGAAGAFIDPSVPVGRLEGNTIASFWDRDSARIFQAPQAFRREVLLRARGASKGREFQSTAQMVMFAGHGLHAVAGEAENIKITAPLDWQIATKVIAPLMGLI